MLLCLGVTMGVAFAQQEVSLVQVSAPQGLLSGSNFVTTGIPVTSMMAPATVGGHTFVGWSVGGVYQRSANGAAINPISITLYAPTTITANYVPTGQDSEGAGVPDWYKLLNFGTTNIASGNQPTGDGFSLLTKYQRGYDPNQFVMITDGGVSRRDSASVDLLLDTSLVYLTQVSDPAGIVSQRGIVKKGTTASTVTAPVSSGGYQFAGWYDTNGIRIDAPGSGSTATVSVGTSDLSVTARYLPVAQDSNANGVPDWWEVYYLSTLTNSAQSQPAGDGFSLLTIYQRGYNPLQARLIMDGGISRRDSAPVQLTLIQMDNYQLLSDPPGILSVNSNVVTGTSVTSPNLLGNQSGGYRFAYWSTGGVPHSDAAGAALGQITFVPTNGYAAVAHYVPAGQDTNANGVPDWWEYNNFTSLVADVTRSPSGDGFSILQNYQRGYDPHQYHLIVDGGVSRRDSALIAVDLQLFERGTQMQIDGTLTAMFSTDPGNPTGWDFGTNAAPVMGDWNGDGLPDLFVFSQGGLRVFRNIGTSSAPNFSEVTRNFTALAPTLSSNANPVASIGDWAGVGRKGLVIGGSTGILSFYLSTGDFTTVLNSTPDFSLSTGSPINIPAFANFTTGSPPDLLVMTSDGTVRHYRNTGNPSAPYDSFTTNALGTAVPGASGMAVSDVNGDGIPDVLVSDGKGAIWEFRGNAGGGFTLISQVWGGSGNGFATGLVLTTFDPAGTGYPDVIAGTAGGSLVYLRNPTIGRPSGLSALAGADSILLGWNAQTQSRLKGYYVYRATQSPDTWTKLTAAAELLPSLRDMAVSPGSSYLYRISAISYQYLPGNSVPKIVETDPSATVSATAGHVRLSLLSRHADPSGIVRIPVSVENSMGLATEGMSIRVSYDPTVLTPIVQDDPSLPAVQTTGLSHGIQFNDNAATAHDELVINGVSGRIAAGRGKLFTLVFQVKDGAPSGSTTELRVLSCSLNAVGGATLTVGTGPSSIVTVGGNYYRGDVNGDGVVDRKDLDDLLRLILQVSPSPSDDEIQAGDLNANGSLDQQDAVLLQRMLESLPDDQ